MDRISGNLCAVDGCRSSKRRDRTLSFFNLPASEEIRKTWLEVIGRPDLARPEMKSKSHFVCSLHFEPNMIKYIPHLKPKALPTKLLSSQKITSNFSNESKTQNSSTETENSTVDIISAVTVESKSVQTTEEEDLSSSSPKKRKLSEDSNQKRRKLENDLVEIKVGQSEKSQTSEQFTSKEKDEVMKRFYNLLDWRKYLKKISKRSLFKEDFKLFALKFYISCPNTYKGLWTFLSLPSESELHRFKIIIPPAIEDRTLEFLSAKLKSLPKTAVYCTLCLDAIVLKRHLDYDTKGDEIIGLHNINGEVKPEIASHACVIMLRGILVNWQQPIAYSFLGSPKDYKRLELWLDEVILYLSNIGIHVKAIVSDQAPYFDKYAKQVKNVTKEKPYFRLNGKKVYYIFNVPHLIKCIRNKLLTNDFVYDSKKISWKHLDALYYSKQEEINLKLIPKITEAHIKPNKTQKMKVKYAAQIFNQSVYAALKVHIFQKSLPEEASATAEFVEQINNLFDVLNSGSVNPTKPFQIAFSFKNYQFAVLNDAITTFDQLKAIDPQIGFDTTDTMKTFKNIQITIQSIIMLCNDLKQKGFNYIFTRRLNLDSLQKFIRTVRQHKGNYRGPTAIYFQRAFSRLFLSNMLKNSTKTMDQKDVRGFLKKNDDFLKKIKAGNPTHCSKRSAVFLNGETDYRFELPTQSALIYISGYLIYKCSEKHTCPELTSVLNKIPSVHKSRMFTHFKTFNKSSPFFGKLKVPPISFHNYVKKMESIFTENFERNNNMLQKPGSTIFQLLKNIPFECPCTCFPLEYLIKLFITFRIYTTMRFNNREFQKGNKNINCYGIK